MKRKRWIALGLLSPLGLLLLSALATELAIDADTLERRANEALRETRYSLRIERVDPDLITRSIRAERITLTSDSMPEPSYPGTELEPGGRVGSPRISGTIGAVELSGIGLFRLLVRRELRASSLTVVEPDLQFQLEAAEAGLGRPTPQGGDNEPGQRSADEQRTRLLALSTALPKLRFASLSIDRGRLVVSSGPGPRSARHLFESLALTLRDVRVDSAAALDTARTLFAREFRLELEAFRSLSSDSLTELVLGPVRTADDECAIVGRLDVHPTVSDDEFQRRLTYRKDRLRVFAGPLSFCSVQYGRLAARSDLLIGRILIDSLFVDVFTDKRLPSAGDRPWRLHSLAQKWPGALRIDSIRVPRGDVFYSERPPDADVLGSISFREIDATITHVINVRAAHGKAGTTTTEARTLLAGRSPVHVTIELDLTSREVGLRYLGNIGRLDLTRLNRLLIPLEGIEITGGRADSTWFDIEVQKGSAFGGVVAVYRGLEFRVVGPEGEESGLIGALKTLIADAKIRNHNPPEGSDTLRVGTVDYVIKGEDTFFQILWNPLRAGLRDLVGL